MNAKTKKEFLAVVENGAKMVNFVTETQAKAMIKEAKRQAERETAKAKKEAQKEAMKGDKREVVEKYRSLFATFNHLKKETKLLKGALRGVNAVDLLGSMNVSKFISKLKNGAQYSISELHEFAQKYHKATSEQRLLIADRGEKLNALIMDFKNGAELNNVLEEAFKIVPPTRTNKDGAKVNVLSSGAIAFLAGTENNYFALLNLAPIHAENLAKKETAKIERAKETLQGVETETAKAENVTVKKIA